MPAAEFMEGWMKIRDVVISTQYLRNFTNGAETRRHQLVYAIDPLDRAMVIPESKAWIHPSLHPTVPTPQNLSLPSLPAAQANFEAK
jgi:hypothetical protein